MLYKVTFNNHLTKEENTTKYLVPEVFSALVLSNFIEILMIEIINKN